MKYKYIQAWGKQLGSLQAYVDRMKTQARAENAPEDAIYYSSTQKRWVRAVELEKSNPLVKGWLDNEVKRYTQEEASNVH